MLQKDLLNLDQDAQRFAESIAERVKFRASVLVVVAGSVLTLVVLHLLEVI